MPQGQLCVYIRGFVTGYRAKAYLASGFVLQQVPPLVAFVLLRVLGHELLQAHVEVRCDARGLDVWCSEKEEAGPACQCAVAAACRAEQVRQQVLVLLPLRPCASLLMLTLVPLLLPLLMLLVLLLL